jgi:peroxiredoxin
MRRITAALVVVLALAPTKPGLVRADDPPGDAKADVDKAATDYKALTDWLETESKKATTKEAKVALHGEILKHLRAFVTDHPKGGDATMVVKRELAKLLEQDKKYDEALALFEELLKAENPDYVLDAEAQLVRTLIEKKDWKKARTRLDPFLKDHPDDKNLQKLDGFLKESEAGSNVKVGAACPAFKAKTVGGDEVSLEGLKDKVAVLEFWAPDPKAKACWAEVAGLKKAYADLKAKGLELVGIAIAENNEERFKAAIAKAQIAWPQVLDVEGSVVRTFAATKLPYSVLVGKDGKILALGLRGDDLTAAIRAVVDGKPVPTGKPEKKKPDSDD